nr:hypothetical protein [Tanacetum cinerariifolium]
MYYSSITIHGYCSSITIHNTQDALSKLLQLGTVAEYEKLLRSKLTTLGEAFSLAHITEARFEDERSTTTIVKPNDLNIGVHVQDLEEMTRHKPNKVEAIKSSGSSLLMESKYYAANQVGLIFNQSNEAIYFERILELIARPLCQYLCKHILDFGCDLQEANLQLKTWDPGINSFRHHLEDKMIFEGVGSDTPVVGAQGVRDGLG